MGNLLTGYVKDKSDIGGGWLWGGDLVMLVVLVWAGVGGGAPALHTVFYNHLPACVVHCCTRQTNRFQDTCTVVAHRSFMFFFEV